MELGYAHLRDTWSKFEYLIVLNVKLLGGSSS